MFRLAAMVACATLLGSCATAVRGTTERFDVKTEPAGVIAKFTITPLCDTECLRQYYPETAARIGDRAEPITTECVTPCMINPQRATVITVNLTKVGYQPRTAIIHPKVRAGAVAVAGNAIIGGATGVLIDAASGAALDHCPNPLIVQLLPVGSRLPEPPIGMECLLRPEDDAGAAPTYRN